MFSRIVTDYEGNTVIPLVPKSMTDNELISSLNNFSAVIAKVRREGIDTIYISDTDVYFNIANLEGFIVQYKFLGFTYKKDKWKIE